jgi:hypothetical protein
MVGAYLAVVAHRSSLLISNLILFSIFLARPSVDNRLVHSFDTFDRPSFVSSLARLRVLRLH